MTDEDEKTRKALEDAEQAKLPYKWTQTIRDVSVTAPIPGNLKGKDMDVDLRKDSIRVGIRGETPIIEVPFFFLFFPLYICIWLSWNTC